MTLAVQAVGQRHAYNGLLMRIWLYWNATAGDETPLDAITAQIRRAGHEVTKVLREKDAPASVVGSNAEALVAAGGDGTVARAARALAGSAMPLAILPLGTANNIATSLGINDDPAAAIAAWSGQQVTRMDIGVVTDEHGEHLFVEGVGTGLLPKGIAHGRNHPAKHRVADVAEEMHWARGMFLDALDRLQPQHSRISID